MKIGELARLTGTKAETIRYYEKIMLLRAPERTGGNYRDYGQGDQDRLTFIRHARELGFEIAEIRSLLDLEERSEQDPAEVERIVTRHIQVTRRKIAQLTKLQAELQKLQGQLRAGKIADQRILRSLADSYPTSEEQP